jgi:peptidoglycan hydrolase CwlO-like protein
MENLLTIVVGAAGTIGGLFIGTRKAKADARQSELDGVEKAIKIWREMAEELREEVDTLKAKVEQLQSRVQELMEENTAMQAELDKLKT